MSRHLVINTCMLLAVTSYAHAQYIDFFNFNPFLQPFTTSKPRNAVTKRPEKHRQTTKQKYQDAIYFETDDIIKQKEISRTIDPYNIFSTTTKPRRKSSKSTITSQNYIYTTSTSRPPKPDTTNKIINNNNRNNNNDMIRSVSNSNRGNNVDGRAINNARRIDNYNNNEYNLYNIGYNNHNINSETTKLNRPTTQRTTTTTDYYGMRTTQKTNYYHQTTHIYNNERTTHRPNNRRTTKNPLLNRPGVKPAAVDENRPPITNRPVTERPIYDRPYDSSVYQPNTRPPFDPRPVNTRPPFEPERPISTGVARPVPELANEDTEVEIEIGPDEDEMSDAEKRRLYDICEKKCTEYKNMRVKKVVALPLSTSEVNVSSCAPDTAPLIIGGQLARIETFPHMALVGWKNLQTDGYAWKCGGSLISEQYVLTAGHCTYHDKDSNVVSGPPQAVQLGSAIYNDRTATVVTVSLVVRHPKYKLRRSYYDVALIKLAAEVTFSDTIMPACLGVPPSVGQPIVATGWGKTEYGGDSSIQLRSVSIPVWDMNDCRDIWGTSLKLPNGPMPDNQICAGERKGAKDTCQGDSGGPAQVREACLWRVVAVTSVGRSCGAPETPALYARVPRAFIAKQVYTNIKPGRDGNNQYGNAGNNGNNNNWNTENSNGNNFNQNGNQGTWNTRPTQNNNGQNNGGRPINNNNNQYYGDSQSASSVNQGNVNNNGYNQNNGYNSWAVTDNNRYNGNNNHNQNYGNNGQTTNSYNSQNTNYNTNNNNFGQNYNYAQNSNSRSVQNPSDIRTYDTQNYNNDNGRTDNAYNRNNDNGYNNYSVGSRPWWTR